ncbi:MAG: hypothetical protein AAF490_11525 [Chloroflexota bacterium]
MSSAILTQKDRQERLSVLLVLGMAALSLILGTFIRSSAQNQTRPFTTSGVSAEIPTGWLTQDGTADLIFVARNSQSLDQLYRVNLLDGGDLDTIVNRHGIYRQIIEESYRTVEQTPIIASGREGIKVTYAFIDDEDESMPTVIEGVAYYFPEGDQILVISYEADVAEFEEGFENFQAFRSSVTVDGGGS